LEVISRSDQAIQLELTVEGLDGQWTAIPVPTFGLEPRSERTERVFLKPPRESGSVAGNYPFVIRVRDLETGESQSVQGLLEIRSFHHLSLDAQPKKALVTPTRKETEFQITVMNLGNFEESLTFFSTDIDDNYAYEFDPEMVSVGPGYQKLVTMKATATKSSLLSNSRLHAVTISARSTTTPAVGANTTAQIEQRALVSPGTAIVAFVLGLIAFLWVLFLPKPPLITSFSADKGVVTVGESVTLAWETANASSVTLDLGGERESRLPGRGSRTFSPQQAGVVTVLIEAVANGQNSKAERLTIEVRPKVVAKQPEILQMSVATPKVRFGSTFRINYKFNEAVASATLSPTNQTLDPRGDGVEVQATTLGKTPYKIIARNADGVLVERVVIVEVERVSNAAIQLKATPDVLEVGGGLVRLSWTSSNALRAEITIDGQTQPLDLTSGAVEFFVSKTTTVVVTVFDADNLPKVERLTIRVKQPEPPPPSPGEGTTGPGTGVTPSGTPSGPVTPPGT
jgi:hypothetical protein